MSQKRDLTPVSVYLFPKQKDGLQKEADERGLSLSSYIRTLLLDIVRGRK